MARIKRKHRNTSRELLEKIENLRKKKPEDFKSWMSTECIGEICGVLEEAVFEINDEKTRRWIRTRIRRILDRYDLEKTRIKCDRDNNGLRSKRLNLEIHRPAPNDDDYMKFELSGVR
jgi:hypothetical protein